MTNERTKGLMDALVKRLNESKVIVAIDNQYGEIELHLENGKKVIFENPWGYGVNVYFKDGDKTTSWSYERRRG